MKINNGLKNYLEKLDKDKKNGVILQIISDCGLTTYSWEQRFCDRTPFKKLEKEKIAEITGLTVDELFSNEISEPSIL